MKSLPDLRHRLWAHCALVALLAAAPYAATLFFPFHLDDAPSIVDNPVIKDLGRFLGGEGFHYNSRRFVGYLSFALNYHLGGLSVVGYHLVNIAIHIVSSLLVYALAIVTLRTPRMAMEKDQGTGSRAPTVALLAALLFAVHPIQTQAITYIVQRVESLAALFYLLSVVLYAKGRLGQKRGSRHEIRGSENKGQGTKDKGQRTGFSALRSLLYFSASLLAGVAALLTKETAFTLPLALLLYELTCFPHRPWVRRLLLAPFVAAGVLGILILLGHNGPLDQLFPGLLQQLQESSHIPRWDYFVTQFRVIVTYLRLLVFPVGQNLDYAYPIYASFFEPPVLLSLLLICSLLGVAGRFYWKSGSGIGDRGSVTDKGQRTKDKGRFYRSRIPNPESRLLAFGILWFFLTLTVVSSVIPIADVIFEHRLYLPSAGIFIALAVLFIQATRRIPAKASLLAGSMIILLLMAATVARNEVWRSPLTLWSDVVQKSPGKERAWCNLGFAQLEAGRLDDALASLVVAEKLNPGYAKTHLVLGVALGQKKLWPQAEQSFRRALQLDANLALAHYNLGIINGNRGRFDEGIRHLEEALRLQPFDDITRSKLLQFRNMQHSILQRRHRAL